MHERNIGESTCLETTHRVHKKVVVSLYIITAASFKSICTYFHMYAECQSLDYTSLCLSMYADKSLQSLFSSLSLIFGIFHRI